MGKRKKDEFSQLYQKTMKEMLGSFGPVKDRAKTPAEKTIHQAKVNNLEMLSDAVDVPIYVADNKENPARDRKIYGDAVKKEIKTAKKAQKKLSTKKSLNDAVVATLSNTEQLRDRRNKKILEGKSPDWRDVEKTELQLRQRRKEKENEPIRKKAESNKNFIEYSNVMSEGGSGVGRSKTDSFEKYERRKNADTNYLKHFAPSTPEYKEKKTGTGAVKAANKGKSKKKK